MGTACIITATVNLLKMFLEQLKLNNRLSLILALGHQKKKTFLGWEILGLGTKKETISKSGNSLCQRPKKWKVSYARLLWLGCTRIKAETCFSWKIFSRNLSQQQHWLLPVTNICNHGWNLFLKFVYDQIAALNRRQNWTLFAECMKIFPNILQPRTLACNPNKQANFFFCAPGSLLFLSNSGNKFKKQFSCWHAKLFWWREHRGLCRFLLS